MTSFSSLLSSLDKQQTQAPQPSTSSASKSLPTQPDRKANGAADRFKLTPSNAVAGVKRRSVEPQSAPNAKIIKIEQGGLPSRPAVPSSRFQLSSKSSVSAKPPPTGQRPATAASVSSVPSKAPPRQLQKPGTTSTITPPGTADGSVKPKKGFAAMLERAKAAEAAAKTAGPGGIKHKAVEKTTKRERDRMKAEALAQQQKTAVKKGQLGTLERSRSGTPNGSVKPVALQKRPLAPESTYKGTMKKAPAVPEPVAYRGTMGKVRSGPKPEPKKGLAQDKYGGYADWDDLDDASDEEEEPDDYDSEDDMEGGFDDLEAEETAALRVAKKEDQAALEEETKLQREKMERKKKLLALSKTAAAKRKY